MKNRYIKLFMCFVILLSSFSSVSYAAPTTKIETKSSVSADVGSPSSEGNVPPVVDAQEPVAPVNMDNHGKSAIDEVALQHMRLRDFSSMYIQSNGSESMSPVTGDLIVPYTDFQLPGSIPFELIRVYDSSLANEEIGVIQEATTGEFVNHTTAREEEKNALGRGWRWDLPYIKELDQRRYVYLPGTGTYYLSEDNKLEGYPYQDVNIQSNITATVNGQKSVYKISFLNGYHYYFEKEGNLILIKDNYENKVEFHYNQQHALTKIINSDGNELTFSYSDNGLNIQQTGTTHTSSYKLSNESNIKVLSEVVDALSRRTVYKYEFPTAKFNVVEKGIGQADRYGINPTALLKEITSPTQGVTHLGYTAYTKHIGEYATQTVFKLTSREESDGATKGYYKKTFTYSNEDLNTFGSSATWTSTVRDDQSSEIFTFLKKFDSNLVPDRVFIQKHVESGDGVANIQEYEYEPSTSVNKPKQVREYKKQNAQTSDDLVSQYRYNQYGQILSFTNSEGQEVSYQYQYGEQPYFWAFPSLITTKLSNNQFQVQEHAFNPNGSLIKRIVKDRSNGKVLAQTEYEYDSFGNEQVQKIKDNQRTIVVNMEYQSPYGRHFMTARSIKVTDISNQSNISRETYEYQRDGRIIKITDASGNEQMFSYDTLGRIVSTKYSDQTMDTMEYLDASHQIKATARDGIVTTRNYNSLGMLLQEQTADTRLQFEYDLYGQLVKMIDAENNPTQYVYDSFGRVARTNYADGTFDRVEYDDINRTVTTIDMNDNRERSIYDILGRTIKMQEFVEGTYIDQETVQYDLQGRAVTRTDGNQQQTRYSYDVLDQLIEVVDPLQQVTKYEYSQSGQLILIQAPDGQQATRKYDELGRLIERKRGEDPSEKFTYDERGNVTRYVDRKNQSFRYHYDSNNYLLEVQGPDFKTTFTYDADGRRTQMTDAYGTTRYDYNPTDGTLAKITYPDGMHVAYNYNTQERTGYTFTAPTGAITDVRYDFDSMNRMDSIDISSNAGNMQSRATTAIDRVTFQYQQNSLLKGYTFGTGLQMSMGYNGYDLSQVNMKYAGQSLQEYQYRYDNNKNLTTIIEPEGNAQFTYDELSRIQTEDSNDKTERYLYDENGNRAQTGTSKIFGMVDAAYTFDSLNQLTQVAGEGKTVTYAYNGYGLLYERVEGDIKNRYYYDEYGRLIAESEGTLKASPQLTYVYVYDLEGRLLARQDKKSGQMQYYQLNGHQDVVGITDSAGEVLNRYSYDIWGGPEVEEEKVPNVLRYSGEYWDHTTGLQYLRARWYDPSLGRFVSEDAYEGQINNPLTQNLYTYTANNPLKYTDPSGHCFTDWLGKKYCTAAWDWTKKEAKKTWNDLKTIHSSWYTAVDYWSLGSLSQIREYYEISQKNPYSFEQFLAAGLIIVDITPQGKTAKLTKKGSGFINKAVKVGCNCFTAGTKVLTEEGEKNIEDIEVGDMVLARDENTPNGELAYKEVTNLYRNQRDDIIKLYVDDQIIETTDNHPFWVEGKGWIFADELQEGDKLQKANGSNLTIDKVEFIKLDELVTVYNFTVADYHTYYVTDIGIWVHNTNCMFGAKGVRTTSKTIWKENGSKARIDVENPNPGQRPGQIHYQDANNKKYLFDPQKGAFVNSNGSLAPKSVNKMLKDSNFVKKLNVGLTQYLGESPYVPK